MSPLTGHAILNSSMGTATGWLMGHWPASGYAMCEPWPMCADSSGVRCIPSQQLGAW